MFSEKIEKEQNLMKSSFKNDKNGIMVNDTE